MCVFKFASLLMQSCAANITRLLCRNELAMMKFLLPQPNQKAAYIFLARIFAYEQKYLDICLNI